MRAIPSFVHSNVHSVQYFSIEQILVENFGVTLDPSLLATDTIYSLIEILESSANSIC
jgi:hypothetical protein